MVSGSGLLKQRSKSEGYTFLKYSDVPFGTATLTVRVTNVRATPKLNSPCALDIEKWIECDGKRRETDKTSIPLNQTNLKALMGIVGDDITAAKGMLIDFGFSLKNNPNARTPDEDQVMGLDLQNARIPPAPQDQQVAAASGKRK